LRDHAVTRDLLQCDKNELVELLSSEFADLYKAREILLLPDLVCAVLELNYGDAINNANLVAREIKDAAPFEYMFGEGWLPPDEVRRLMGYLISCHKADCPVIEQLRQLRVNKNKVKMNE
jgi:hypothetical protein